MFTELSLPTLIDMPSYKLSIFCRNEGMFSINEIINLHSYRFNIIHREMFQVLYHAIIPNNL